MESGRSDGAGGSMPSLVNYSMCSNPLGWASRILESSNLIVIMGLTHAAPSSHSSFRVYRKRKEKGKEISAHTFLPYDCSQRTEKLGTKESLTDSVNGSGSMPITFKHFLSTELFKTGRRIPASNSMPSSNTEKSYGKPRLTSTYNTLIDLYGKAGRLKDAADVFSDMLKSGVAMDTITFNTMIFVCGSHGDLLEAESLLSKMEERGISPDTKTYNILLSLYANAGNINAALSCYRRIREVGLFPDDVTHRALLGALCEHNMVRDVEAVIEEMEKSHVSLDEHSLPGIIKMYVNEGAFDKANDLLQNCREIGHPSSKICAAIMDVFADKGLWAEAESMFFRKRDMVGQSRDVAEYNVMIKAYGTAKLFDKAVSLFKGMRNQGTWPDECTYNSLIQMLSGADLVDQAREFLAEMQGMGFKPPCQTFSAIIGCYARLGQLSDAINVYQDMLQAKVQPNEVVYGSLVNGFAEYGSLEEALQYLHKMEESGISANLVVLTSLLKAYCKVGSLEGAKSIYERMKDMEGGLDIVACNSMIGLFADLGMVSEAKLVFENLREKGWADGVSYATMMYLYKNIGMLDDAIEIAEEMKLLGLLKDCVTYNKVLVCYATNGNLRECGELMHQMISQNLLPNEGTLKVLFTVLKKGGFPVEAVAQLESYYREGKPYARQTAITALYSLLGMHDLALESARAFLESSVSLNSVAYNVAIYAYGSAGDTGKAFNIFMKMHDEEVEPDLVTYINLVNCYGKAGMIEGVKRIYSQIKYGEIEPSESLFKAIIDAYRIAKRQDLVELVSQEMRFTFNSLEHSGTGTGTETEDESNEASSGP
ncbi:pentatricopeptide repeat-containing protein [Senna tora]|uniref:Pentatricopeptide repeat-containing protein n=1 Tax=Senna tora TaxID=362788 RepID=A0A834XCV3_9FABA|nr:pentatricopeptide repeat-containing protein [Senna tora]